MFYEHMIHTPRLICVENIMFKTVYNMFNSRNPEPACTRYIHKVADAVLTLHQCWVSLHYLREGFLVTIPGKSNKSRGHISSPKSCRLFSANAVRLSSYSAVQSEKAVSAYFTSKQILPSGFANQYWTFLDNSLAHMGQQCAIAGLMSRQEC